jgi:hypothetical protein
MTSSSRERIYALSERLEQEGFVFRPGRPKNKKGGPIHLMSQALGLSPSYIHRVLKEKKRLGLSATSDAASTRQAQDTDASTHALLVLEQLCSALDAFIGEAIRLESGSFPPDLILWADRGIEIIRQIPSMGTPPYRDPSQELPEEGERP